MRKVLRQMHMERRHMSYADVDRIFDIVEKIASDEHNVRKDLARAVLDLADSLKVASCRQIFVLVSALSVDTQGLTSDLVHYRIFFALESSQTFKIRASDRLRRRLSKVGVHSTMEKKQV